jgi:hypothetical protein
MECIVTARLLGKQLQHWVPFALNKEHVDVCITVEFWKLCAWQSKE